MPKNVRLFYWFNFFLDFRLYAPIQILYFAQVTGSYALGMSLFSVTMLASSFFEVPTGVFSDRIGRKRTIICGSIASVCTVTFYAIGGAYSILLIGAVFEGLMRSLFSGNNEAMLHDTLTEAGQEDSYQEYLGKVSSRYQAALAVSAVLGSFIAYLSFEANGTYNLVVWLSVFPQLLCLFVSFQFIDPNIHSEHTGNIYAHLREAYFNIVKNAKLRTLSTGWILSFAIGEASFQFRVAFINALWPLWAIGIARTISNIAASVSFYMAGRLIKRFGEFRLMIGGMTFSETTNLMSLLFPGVLSPMFMGMTSIFYGVNMVSIGGLMQREFTPQQRATMGSLNAFAGSIVFAIISFSLGLLADHVGVIRALTIATLFSYLPIVFYWKSFHTKPNTTGHTSPQTPSPAQR